MSAHDHTIAALSTPPGQSAIAVVRMSGDDALAILSRVFRARSCAAETGEATPTPPEAWEHHHLYVGRLYDADGAAVDDVVCAVMRAPDSYTGDDVVEISCHGGPVVVSRVLSLLYRAGARPAEPGEFTRRAFLAGKMDLIQAEAVADLIHAQSELQRAVAHRQLGGGLSQRIGALADDVLGLLGLVEANIDFIEEDIDALDVPAATAMLERHARELAALLEGAELSRPFRDGYRVVIAGPVNAGKSSLFNRLLGEARAIVTEIPGTTRDVLREPVVIDGLVFVFHDTAGLRTAAAPGETPDRVEAMGIDLATSAAESADAVVFVIDGSAPADAPVVDAVGALDPARAVVALNKGDRAAVLDGAGVKTMNPQVACVTLSALTGEGVDDLKGALVALVGGDRLAAMARERVVLNARLVSLLRDAVDRSAELRESLAARKPLELTAVDVRELLSLYEQATGRRYESDLLDVIFSRFCIGK